ncbi:hypothetical protein Pfo_022437 [Paulownia fortunei]|nr:hypothetical protein Pfo_022437 [Paulownia fortunei]
MKKKEKMERAMSHGMMMMMMMIGAVRGNEYEYDDSLSFSYYHGSCPQLERIIHNKLNQWLKNDSTLAPALMRLHFHDCTVRGCDASILLNHKGSERTVKASKSLRGFQVIDDIKAEVEKKCPKTVSCADILTAAARDATVAAGGPFWMLPYGRKDGRVSFAKEAESVPMGAHTIGRSTCGSLQYRLFNYKGTGKPDPSIDPKYLNFLRRKCRWASEYVELDAVTPKAFDVQYYKNLQKKMGLLSTDQMLYSDSRTAPLVSAFASQSAVFHHQFAASMVKLGNIQDYLADEDGEIRLDCNYVNA